MRSFDDVSLGSPAATVITIASSQATYNTNAQKQSVQNQLSASQSRLLKDQKPEFNKQMKSEPVQKQMQRVSIPTPVSVSALENLNSSGALDKPLKNIKAMNINEEHRFEEPSTV